MIDVKDAVRITLEYVRELFDPEEIPNLTLEEVEISPDGDHWLVTVSFQRSYAKSPIEAMTGHQSAPIYKIVKVHAETGQVLSMKIRTV